jgi:hypothetical protein
MNARNKKTGGNKMKIITAVVAVMCAFSAYASYPSAEERRQSMMETLSPQTMQVSRLLPTEAYDAI